MKDSIIIKRELPFPQTRVWEALTQTGLLAQWLMPNDFKLQKGHKFTFQAPAQPFFDGKVQCEVIDFLPMSFLSYSWQGGPIKSPTTVTWRLRPTETGTELVLEHTGFRGLFVQLLVRRILEGGWRKLMVKKLPQLIIKLTR